MPGGFFRKACPGQNNDLFNVYPYMGERISPKRIGWNLPSGLSYGPAKKNRDVFNGHMDHFPSGLPTLCNNLDYITPYFF